MQIGRIAAIDDRESGIEAQLRRIVAQQPVAQRMEGARPGQPLRDGLRLAAERVVERLAQDLQCPAAHLHARRGA